MLSVSRAIYERLSLHEDLIPGEAKSLTLAPPVGLGFLVFNRWLKRSGKGSTAAAFDGTQGGEVRRSIVVRDGGEVLNPSPQGREYRFWDTFVDIHIFAEAHDNGKIAVDEAILRIEELLSNWKPIGTGNSPITLREGDVIAQAESDAFPGNLQVVVTWRATGARQMVAAS